MLLGRRRGGDTNNDPDLEDESQGWSRSVSVSPDPRAMAPLCVSVPVCRCVGTVGGKKAKVLFLARASWDRMGGRPLFKVKLILNFRINEREMACHEKL